jgi:hypothetical protein
MWSGGVRIRAIAGLLPRATQFFAEQGRGMMRVAVMSDIHGFNFALETVLADLDQQGPFDEVVVAGDLCEVGPAPADVLGYCGRATSSSYKAIRISTS